MAHSPESLATSITSARVELETTIPIVPKNSSSVPHHQDPFCLTFDPTLAPPRAIDVSAASVSLGAVEWTPDADRILKL